MDYSLIISAELSLRPSQVSETLALFEGGATVPFIARYRKEATGNLDEVQIQKIIDRAQELKELDARRETIRKSIDEQGKLTPELAEAIARCTTRTQLEDLYLPYRPKRRTRATIAKERGLEPLAGLMWSDTQKPLYDAGSTIESLAAPFVDLERGVESVDAALAGARDIVAERIAEDASLRQLARVLAFNKGTMRTEVAADKKGQTSKFEMYYEYEEPLQKIPSHRVLAIYRGEAENFLWVHLRFPDADILAALHRRVLGDALRNRERRLFVEQLEKAIEDGWKRLLSPSLEIELRNELKERADRAAIDVFGENLRNLLLAPPAGNRKVIAIDPGLRTGSKVAVLDQTGRVRETATLHNATGQRDRHEAQQHLTALVKRHHPDLIAVGNGTGNREAEEFVRAVLRDLDLKIPVVSVSEQGASVYSASEVAREEFPSLDVSLRGAISIGRRLQDPLGELVKIDPKSIGVGQYQHDVNQTLLKKRLGETVDSCVNAVGVDVNTASPQLLEHVSGIGPVLAKRVVAHRNEAGAFPSRENLRDVRGLGPKAFEQAAGFLRIRGGHPLDNSAVHPERYALVEEMARDVGVSVESLVGNREAASRIDLQRYVRGDVGLPTLQDIMTELAKPGRDPRGDFEPPPFREELRTIEDVKEGMILDGVVTNVTRFGAFVDIGVHQDGLVHVSELATRFVRDPAEVVKVGDRVKIKVLSVDAARKRMALSIRHAAGVPA